MANDKNFRIKNGLLAGRYLLSSGTATSGSTPYDLAGASYDSVSFSVSGQDSFPSGITFNNDGTKMYMVGSTSDSVYQYSLSTAFDLNTASYDSVSFSVASQGTTPTSIIFNNDGTKMFMSGSSTDSVYQYTLSTAFDLSTASYDSVSFSVVSQDTSPQGIVFNNDGTKMYMVGQDIDSVHQYSLSTAFDLSTASYDSVSFSVASQEGAATAITFNNDGTKMYVVGAGSDSVYQYTLSTAFDLSTTSYDSVSLSVASQDTGPRGIAFNNAGTKMYVVGSTNDSIYQYSTASYTQTLDLSTGTTFSFTPSGATTVSFTNPPASGNAIGFSVEINGDGSAITWPSSVKWHLATAPTATASKELYTFVTTNGGTTYYGKKAAEGLA
jgi:DNA-binding beta-propeller fold protein YncE